MSVSASYSQPCAVSTGGLTKIWIANKSDVTSFTLTADEFTAVAMSGGAVFYEYEFEQDSASMTTPLDRAGRSGTVTIGVTFFLTKMRTALRNAVQALLDSSTCGNIVIAQDAHGQKWVLGYSDENGTTRPLKLASGDGGTGEAFTDDNGQTIVMESIDNNLPRIFTGTVPV